MKAVLEKNRKLIDPLQNGLFHCTRLNRKATSVIHEIL